MTTNTEMNRPSMAPPPRFGWRSALLSPLGSGIVGALVGITAVVLFWAMTGTRRLAQLEVRTIPLRQLAPAAAVALVTPYINAEGGAVFQSPGVSAITVRERHEQIEQLLVILRTYDGRKPPVLLHFELVVVGDTIGIASGMEPLDAVLRSALPHSGLRRVGDGVLTAAVGQDIEQGLGDGPNRFVVRVKVLDTPSDSSGIVRLHVSGRLAKTATTAFDSEIGIAYGNITILGSALLSAGGHPMVLSLRVSPAEETKR